MESDAIKYLHKNYVAWLSHGQWEPELSLPKGSYPIQGQWMQMNWILGTELKREQWEETEAIIEACFTQTCEIWVVCRGGQVSALAMANTLSTAERQAGLWIGAIEATEALQHMGAGLVICQMGSVCHDYTALPHATMQELSAWWTERSMVTPQERREHRKRIQNYLKKGQYGHIAGYVARSLKREGIAQQAYWHWLPIIMESLWMQTDPPMAFLTKELSMEALRSGGVEQFLVWVRRICLALKAASIPSDPILRVMDSIQRDCSLPYSQANLAEGLGLTPAYFSRLFEKRVGIRFSTYLTNVRINHAKALLRQGATLTEIVQACGYQRKSYFCEVFKKHSGMTALTYRAMLRKDDSL